MAIARRFVSGWIMLNHDGYKDENSTLCMAELV